MHLCETQPTSSCITTQRKLEPYTRRSFRGERRLGLGGHELARVSDNFLDRVGIHLDFTRYVMLEPT